MDHLTYPTERIPLNDIPFFASSLALYDGLGFEDFPSRIRAAHGGDCSRCDQAWFIQGWLYFGLLQEVFGQDLEVQDFIRPAAPGRVFVTGLVITTAQLEKHMRRFDQRQASVLDVVFRHATSENCRVQRLLQFTREECNRLDYKAEPYDPHLPAIMLSVQLLLQRLQHISVGHVPRNNRRLGIPRQYPLSLEPIWNHMVRQSNVWCPHQVQCLLGTFSYEALVYLAEMKRNVGPWFDHTRCFSETRCIGYNIDDKTFRGKHVDGCHGCSHLEAPLGDMYAILEDGGIPILRCRRISAAPDVIALSYEKLTSSSRYVAISHVWSDGLGTPSKNSVPRCQLNRLVGRVQEVMRYKVKWWRYPSRAQIEGGRSPNDDALLWLDVYCVPASSEIERMVRLKRAAIARMVPTYALARLTLVLDHELQNLTLTERDPLNAATEEEFLARVVISGWRTRCWTHQEHQVSRRVLFQCLGSFAAFDNNYFNAKGRKWTELAAELVNVADRSLGAPSQTHFGPSGFYPLGMKKSLTIPELGTVWDSFQGKSTSRPLDALYVLASVMRLSAKQIRDLSPENQIRAILRAAIDQEGGLPTGLFFSQAPRKLNSSEDFRDHWIPRFPGEGGLLAGGELAKSFPCGFIISMLTYSRDRGGCIGLKIRPSSQRFVVSWYESQIEISLSLPQNWKGDDTEILVVLQIPKIGDPFRGVGACFFPAPVSRFRIPWVYTKLFAEYIWCCPLTFRRPEDKVEIDGTNVGAVIVPHEREAREVAIMCGKCSARPSVI